MNRKYHLEDLESNNHSYLNDSDGLGVSAVLEGKNRKERFGKNSSPSTNSTTMIKYVCVFVVLIVCGKFLFYTEPIKLDKIVPFKNASMIQFTTSQGAFTIELFPDDAPKTVAHFRKLVASGFYTDRQAGFYRSEPGFVLQGGSFLHEKKSPQKNLPVEYKRPSLERTVVLARKKHHYSGNSEFAIMLGDNSLVNAPSTIDDNPGYTVFGKIFSGWNTILKISDKLDGGFLSKKKKTDAILFESARTVINTVPTNDKLRKIFDKIQLKLETKYSVVVFSKTFCPYCKNVKKALADINAQTAIIELDLLTDGTLYQDILEVISGRRTVPNVFVGGKSIGGGDDIERLVAENALVKTIQPSGSLAKSLILKTVNSNPVVIFSKSYCPYCKKAKKLLSNLGASLKVIELDNRQSDGDAIQYYLNYLTGRKTVPNVFIQGKSIGGGDETEKLYNSGELKQLLQKAEAI